MNEQVMREEIKYWYNRCRKQEENAKIVIKLVESNPNMSGVEVATALLDILIVEAINDIKFLCEIDGIKSTRIASTS